MHKRSQTIHHNSIVNNVNNTYGAGDRELSDIMQMRVAQITRNKNKLLSS